MNGLLSIIFFHFFLGIHLLVSSQCTNDQKTVLFQLRDTLEFNSSFSTKLLSWDQNTDCCVWKGVGCNLAGQVIALDLSQEAISGGFNDSSILFSLKNLQRLNFAYNKMNFKPIPSRFGNLTSLVYLNLSSSSFSGKIPQFISINNASTTSLLETLDLSSNQLEGEIPRFLFELKRLNTLLLSSNNLNGTIQSNAFQGLHNLTTLDLSYNNLSIEINSRDFSMSPFPQFSSLKLASCNLLTFPNLKNQSILSILDLSNNNISGQIPSWIWGSGNGALLYMNISHNKISGLQTPYVFPKSLSVLDLHSNSINGVIPMPPPFATYIDFSDNRFSSSIPDSIGKYLRFALLFSVSTNLLTGPIPKTICNATYLKVLDLSNNGLTSRIPECLFEFGWNLRVLNLGNNSLSGPIGGTFTQNCSLHTLDLHGNSLEGKIPQSLSGCKMLEFLNLGNNNIDDTYPCFLRNNSNLRVLILRSNMLHGGLLCNPSPSSSTWTKLLIFDIALNGFTGVLQRDLFRNWQAMMTDVADGSQFNFMSLQFDEFQLGNWGFSKSIDISNNYFGGEIPNTIGQLKALKNFNISHNEFTGSIPSSIGDMKQLEAIDMSRNKLGVIPSSLNQLSFLSAFNVSYNQLEGRIPTGNQLQTLDQMDTYIGNMRLCGFPLNESCQDVGTSATPPASTNSHDNSSNFDYMISFGLGLIVGLVSFILPLVYSERWRRWYYQYVDRIFFKELLEYYVRKARTKRAYRNPIRRLGSTRAKRQVSCSV